MPYKEFANGNPLPASDIDTYLMDQAVMTFANSTARSTAIPSPKEGMLTYLEDTNAYEGWTGSAWVNINDNTAAIPKSTVTTAGDLIVANGNASVTRLGIGANGSIPRVSSGALGYLPVGSNGQVLSVSGGLPTWTAPPSSGSLTLLSTTSMAGTATVTISSINQTYKKLYMVISNVSGGSSNWLLRVYPNGNQNTANFWGGHNVVGSGANNNWGTAANLQLTPSIFVNQQTGFNKWILEIQDYSSSVLPKPFITWGTWQASSADQSTLLLGGAFNGGLGSAITSLQVVTTSSPFASGTVELYGVN